MLSKDEFHLMEGAGAYERPLLRPDMFYDPNRDDPRLQ
jgi:hypothetical protein